ncbi:MAG TPA: ABC transporter permease [Candidatus Limnocylindrales bacterium]|nr:ABC transporter permease [Candidatus Limnocylindrales bacterium]
MAGYIVRRVLWLIPVLFVVSVITFTLMHLVPGGPWSSDKAVAPGVQAAINRSYHLNEPFWQQYGRWVFDFIRGDFGPSFKYADRSINQIIAEGAPATIQLGLMAFGLAVIIGIPLGIIAALGHNRWPDYVATFVSMIGISTPSFVLAILLIVVFSVWLKWLPPLGWRGPDTWVMPVVALAGYQIAQIARYTRASMLEVTRKDYIRTAHSKGLRERAVVVRHMIRNALIPVITILGPILAFLVTGSFIIEAFFGIPGIGRYYVQGIVQRDYSLIMAMTVIYAFAVAAMNVVVDVLYGYIDPRIRYS